MKKVFLLAIAASFTFVACNKDKKAEATTTATETNAAHEDHTGHDHGAETPAANQSAQGQATNAPAATNAQGVKLNPPHGEPGHRCEIAVGAPLDGSAAPTQATPAPAQPASGKGFLGSGNTQTQAAPTQQAAPTAQKGAPAQQTAPGMQGKPNPAHGQPGHRCDIQVGQPLP